MGGKKHCSFYPTVAWLLILSLITPSASALSAGGKKEESRKNRIFSNSSVTLLVDRDYLQALKETIDKAKKEITLSFYHFKTMDRNNTYPDIILASLARASERGVKVSVLLEQGRDPEEGNTRENKQTLERLKRSGVTVHLDTPSTTTHTKMAVVDGKYTFIGSHNLTQSALKYNNEISVMIESPQVAMEALDYIRSLVANGF